MDSARPGGLLVTGFAGHDLHFETPRLRLRPFDEADFDLAVPFYQDPEFLKAMEGDPPRQPVTASYLRAACAAMVDAGFYFAVVERSTGAVIGEACLQWMNLDRARKPGERVMRLPLGIWDKTLWGRGYGREIVERLMAYAFCELEIDWFCPVDIRSDNDRSIRLWESCGLSVARRVDGGDIVDFEISRNDYLRRAPSSAHE